MANIRVSDGPREKEVTIVCCGQNRALKGPVDKAFEELQKLEELAEKASKSDDPTELRTVIRRSLSLNVAPSGECTKWSPSFDS